MSTSYASPRKRRRPIIGEDDTDEEETARGSVLSGSGMATRSRVSTRSPSVHRDGALSPGRASGRLQQRGAASPLGSPSRSVGSGVVSNAAMRRSGRATSRAGTGSPSASPSASRATSPSNGTGSRREVRIPRQSARGTARTAAMNAAEAAAAGRAKNGRGVPAAGAAAAKLEEENRKEKEEEEERRQRWKEEFFEIVEQLPLELHRSFSLMKELESQMLDRLCAMQRDAKSYRDARRQLKVWKETNGKAVRLPEPSSAQLPPATSGDVDEIQSALLVLVKEEEDATTAGPDQAREEPATSSLTPPSRSDRMALLKSLVAAANDSIRAAEEKSGLAATAYDWVDRHIRRLDGDLQRGENALLLGLRVGTEESRGLREALGTSGAGGADEKRAEKATALGTAGASRARGLRITLAGAPAGRVGGSGPASAGLKSSSSPMFPASASTDAPPVGRARRPPPKKRNAKPLPAGTVNGLQGLDFLHDMPVEENEPKYCYCDQVSFGDMIACDNEYCPREWFHYSCIGMNAPPKGRWYCQFCAPSGWRGSGMAVPVDAVAKPPGWKK